jgi:hypothetical protein
MFPAQKGEALLNNLNITGVGIYEAFFSGYQEVVNRRSYLNRINFFPVPDGDTGTNLVSTFSAIADSLKAERSAHAIFGTMADAAIIIAQFISGLKRETRGHERLDARQFSLAALGASRYADAAVSEPAEGTILTVIRDWATALIRLSEKIPEPGRLLHEAFAHAGASLEKTRTGTEANRKAGVEDAGASGFVSFLEGLNGYIAEGKRFRRSVSTARLDIQKEAAGHGAASIGEIGFRYCTEALIEGEHLEPVVLRGALKGFGDSLIVSTEYPTSSLPEERDVANLFSFLSTHYTSAVMLPVGAMLSGTKALFDRINEGMGDDFGATVIDTRMNSAAQGLLVLSAAEAAEAGDERERGGTPGGEGARKDKNLCRRVHLPVYDTQRKGEPPQGLYRLGPEPETDRRRAARTHLTLPVSNF